MADWHQHAACVGAPADWFFPPDNARGRNRRILYDLGKAVCETCSVRQECLDEAQRLRDGHGLRGGLTPEQRGYDSRGVATPQRACVECGQPYTPGKPSQRYCTPRCARTAHLRQKRDADRRRREQRAGVA